MKLYTHPVSPNCRKIHGVAAHAGLAIDQQIVDLFKGEQKQPDFLAINPMGKVPALVDGDTILWESNAITCYVAGKAESDLWPKSNQRYDILRWMFWESNHWARAIGTVIGQKIFNADNPDQAIIDKGIADFRSFASVLDAHLGSHDFLSGEALTVADFAVGVWLGYTDICELPLSEFNNIAAWSGRLNELPAWGEMHPPQPKAA
jgi:glutathione S-transferase